MDPKKWSLSGRFAHAWALGSVFLLPGVVMIYLKGFTLRLGSGYLAITRYLGRASAEDLSFMERLSLFREDILMGFILLPLTLILCTALLPAKVRSAFALIVTSVFIFIGFASLMSVANVGSYLTSSMASDALQWAFDQPDSIFDYASASSLSKLAIMLVFAVVSLVTVHRSLKANGDFARSSSRILGIFMAFALGFYLAGWAKTLPVSEAYRSAAYKIASTFVQDPFDAKEFARLSAAELSKGYAQMSRTAPPSRDALHGAAKDRDVLVFVLETAPEEIVDFEQLLGVGGPLHRLSGGMLIARQHYSTYPYTSDAMFSIFSSQYPAARQRLIRSSGTIPNLGWGGVLANLGYEAREFAPHLDTFEDDTTMYKLMGFPTRRVAGQQAPTIAPRVKEQIQEVLDRFPNRDRSREKLFTKRLGEDLIAWEWLKKEFVELKHDEKRFVFAYAPQIGHGPYFNLDNSEDIISRGKTLVNLQLGWLGELIEIMHRENTLKNTVIVITGDHGLRTQTEYPTLATGVLTRVSMNVPLAIFADGVFQGTEELAAATSHVDIGPSLLWLLGAEDTRVAVHGTPIWNPALSERVLYFFGKDYLGADAFHDRGRFVSCEYFNKTCRHGDSFDFADSNSKTPLPEEQKQWTDRLQAITSLQFGTAQMLTHSDP